MPRISRSPHRDRAGVSCETRDSDPSSLDQRCCRQNQRCGRPLEEPSSSTSSSGHPEEGRRGGRCHVRRQRERERREDFRERARREVLVEEAEVNDKPSTRSRVCRWANIAMGVVIALGLVFVFYVITTIIIDGSSPLDSLFGQKETVDPNLRNFNSTVNGTFGINEESYTKSTEEPTEVVTFPEPRFTSTIFSANTVSGHELENVKNRNQTDKTTISTNYEGRSFTDRTVTLEDDNVDEYYYEDNDDNSETKTRTKTNINKEDNDWDESAIDTSLNHEMIWNDNHQMPDKKNSLSAQIIVNRKGLPPLHRSDGPHRQHNLHRSVDLKYDPITTYSRSVQPNSHIDAPSRRNIYLTDYTDNTEDDETFYNNNSRRRNGNMPSILSPRNDYSDLEQYKLHSMRNQDDNARFGNRDYVPRYRDREYDYQPRDQRYRNSDREAISYQRPLPLPRSEFPNPSVSKRYIIRSREPSYPDSYYSSDRDPFPRKELSYGRSLSTTSSSTADVKLRKLTELEKSQILEIARLKRQQQLSRGIDVGGLSYKSPATPTEYKYPHSATSIQDIIEYMNHRDGKHGSNSRKISNSEEIFREIRTSPGSGFIIGDQDHVIGTNVFKPYNKFDVDNQNYNIPNGENQFGIHRNNNDHFNKNPNMQGSKNSGNNFNNYYKNSNKNGNSYANNNDQRLPLEDAYPSRPRPEQDDHLYSVGTSNPNFNRVNPTVGDPYVGSSSSKSNSHPFSLILDIYPSEEISNDPNAELKTHLSLSDEFQDEYERMMNVGESRFRASELDQNRNEIILHVNLYSKPIRPTHQQKPSNRQEDVALEFPLNGRLSPIDIYRAIVQQKRLSPVASAQIGNYSELITEQSYFDLIAFEADGKSKLYAAIEKGFKGLEPYLRERRQENITVKIPSPEGQHQ